MTDWHLATTSWAGLVAGASHYYGRIIPDDYDGPSYDVTRPVPPELACEPGYVEGIPTLRFDTRAELRAAAIELWKAEGLGGTLHDGLPIYDDRPVLATDT